MPTVKDLQDKARVELAAANALLPTDGTNAAPEVMAQAQEHLKAYRALKAQAQAAHDQSAVMAEIESEQKWLKSSAGVLPGMSGAQGDAIDAALDGMGLKAVAGSKANADQWAYFQRALATGRDNDRDAYHRKCWAQTPQLKAWWGGLGEESMSSATKALSADIDISGGYTLMPATLQSGIIKAMDNNLPLRPLATIVTTDVAQATGFMTLTADLANANWVGETTTVTADSTMAYGRRELHAKFMSAEVIVSRVLLAGSALNLETFIRDRLTYAFRNTADYAYWQGTGVNQPVGIFNATAQGCIPTSRDTTAALTTSIGYNDCVSTLYSLKEQYRKSPKLRAFMNRNAVADLMKITDDNGRPMWKDGDIITGQPDRFFGVPVLESENIPGTLTSGLYVLGFGDLSYYYIADSMDLQITRLIEQHALTMQIGYLGFMATDGQPMLDEAFARLKLA